MCVLIGPSIEQHFGFTIRTIITILVGNEQEVRSCPDKHSPKSDLDAADQIETLGKNLSRLEATVPIGVRKDQDPITTLPFRARMGYS